MEVAVRTVLVVDDEECVRDLVRTVLQNRDCRVLEAPDGYAALDCAQREVPDLILCDCRMPGLSGLQVLSRLRGDNRTAAIPVILMSGFQEEETELAGRMLKAEGRLCKPFRPVQLLEEMHRVFSPTPHSTLTAETQPSPPA